MLSGEVKLRLTRQLARDREREGYRGQQLEPRELEPRECRIRHHRSSKNSFPRSMAKLYIMLPRLADHNIILHILGIYR
jgi:hypothetical protein